MPLSRLPLFLLLPDAVKTAFPSLVKVNFVRPATLSGKFSSSYRVTSRQWSHIYYSSFPVSLSLIASEHTKDREQSSLALDSAVPDIHAAFDGGLRVECKLHEGPRIQGRSCPCAALVVSCVHGVWLLTTLDPAPTRSPALNRRTRLLTHAAVLFFPSILGAFIFTTSRLPYRFTFRREFLRLGGRHRVYRSNAISM